MHHDFLDKKHICVTRKIEHLIFEHLKVLMAEKWIDRFIHQLLSLCHVSFILEGAKHEVILGLECGGGIHVESGEDEEMKHNS